MKFIIACRLPSGAMYAFATFEDKFALVPVEKGVVRKCMAWDTAAQAQAYLDEQLKLAPSVNKLGPFEILGVELMQ